MIQAVALNCCQSTFLVDSNCFAPCSKSVSSRCPSTPSTFHCSAFLNDEFIPKLEPFSRSRIDRAVKDPPLIQKSEDQIADYCLTLEGDETYDCWKAYSELKDLEKQAPKEEVERLIIEAGGVKSLIRCVHGVAAIHKLQKVCKDSSKLITRTNTGASPGPVPYGLPRSLEEIEEEENARMPNSPFTRLLRARGRHPAWYSPIPEHETD